MADHLKPARAGHPAARFANARYLSGRGQNGVPVGKPARKTDGDYAIIPRSFDRNPVFRQTRERAFNEEMIKRAQRRACRLDAMTQLARRLIAKSGLVVSTRVGVA